MSTSRKQQSLSAAMVRTVSASGMYADGNGLNLKVEDSGAKRWVQRVTIGGKRRNLGLGGYPAVSLAEARDLAADNQRAIRQGRDPLAEKRQSAEERRRPAVPTFAQASAQLIAMRRPAWSNAKHAAQWESTLATYAYPAIGAKPVDAVSSGDVLAVLTPIWTSKRETASRVRQRLETVFDWAIAQGWRLDNPAGKAVSKVLPRLPRVKNHHAALPYAAVVAALEQVRESTADPVTRLSFEFLVLTAARSREVRLAEWSEIDWESGAWTVPAARMKARREHRVPLVGRTLEVLSEAQTLDGEGSGLVFPAQRTGKPLSDMAHAAAAPAAGHTGGAARVSQQFQGLVHRMHRHAVDGGGGRPGPQPGQFDGSGLRQKRPLRAAPGTDGGLGRIPGRRRGGEHTVHGVSRFRLFHRKGSGRRCQPHGA